jgi:epoxyqueuosine reductase
MSVQTSNTPPEIDSQPLLDQARALGFGLVGIAAASPSRHAEQVRRWIAEGRHGEMGYLEEHLETRLDPGKLLAGARTVICVADKHPETTEQPPHGPGPHGRIARYAFGNDYHKSMKKRLHKLADTLAESHPADHFRSTVDTAPILEREFAALAGLGWIGKHTLLIHPRYGSYFLLGTIVTTLNLRTTADAGYPEPAVPPTDHCGTCTRCIDACPTACIGSSGPRSVDATRCISYLTLEHRSAIDPSLHEQMGDWVAGCDVCQEVCPHNRDPGLGIRGQEVESTDKVDAPNTGQSRLRLSAPALHPDHTPRPPAPALSLTDILGWSEDDRRRGFRGSALKRIKLGMLKRNALIALGNALTKQDDPAIRQRIGRIAGDEAEPELVRLTARQVLTRLEPGSGRDAL